MISANQSDNGRRGILGGDEALEVNGMPGVLGMRNCAAKRSLERKSGQGPGHGGFKWT